MKIFKNTIFYVVAVAIYIIMLLFAGILTKLFISADAYSFLMRNIASNKNGESSIYEVIYDNGTIDAYGYMSKSYFTDILNYFYEYSKPEVVGFDTRIADYDEKSAVDRKMLNVVSSAKNLVSGYFKQEFSPSYSMSEDLMNIFEKKNSLKIKMNIDDSSALASDGVTVPAQYIKNADNFGSVYVKEDDASQMLLDSPVIVKIKEAYYPSLPFKMYLLKNNTNDVVVDEKNIYVPKTGLKFHYSNNLKKDGTLKIKTRFRNEFVNSYSYYPISARYILDSYYALKNGITPQNSPELFEEGNPKRKYYNPSLFNGKSIMIGSNITGEQADVFKTPMADRHSGVDIQATIYDNLNTSYFVDFWNSNFNYFLQIFLMFLLPVFSFVIILKSNFMRGLLIILGFDIFYFILVFLLAAYGCIISWEMPLAFQFVTFVFGYSFKFITENRNKEKIKNAMGKYLSQDIMKNVVNNIDDLKLGGKRAIVTVLFSDIRGFTSMSEKMAAEDVSVILNEYFSEMEPIIRKYNGVINKFIGDAVMAIFGEPIQDINHPQNAVKCAYEMLKKVEYLREKWMHEGKPKIEIGVGINTGEVFVGNIGTENRMEYTVIGDTVNLASRIEHYNKVYKTNLLVSASTYAHIAAIADVIKISEVQIRGKSKKMNIYEVLRIDRG